MKEKLFLNLIKILIIILHMFKYSKIRFLENFKPLNFLVIIEKKLKKD